MCFGVLGNLWNLNFSEETTLFIAHGSLWIVVKKRKFGGMELVDVGLEVHTNVVVVTGVETLD